LPANRGLPTALFKIDASALKKAGITQLLVLSQLQAECLVREGVLK